MKLNGSRIYQTVPGKTPFILSVGENILFMQRWFVHGKSAEKSFIWEYHRKCKQDGG